jgi:hypothetical protein
MTTSIPQLTKPAALLFEREGREARDGHCRKNRDEKQFHSFPQTALEAKL